ncbi:MAG TPA: hypothetical protein VG013_13580 [Gemmataceae bacterium]|jgi:DNA-directed RNA polymerase subunit RPC12/RpoP|nr:hypothetical protein [Gemmataceae bacterium]
MYQLACSRCGEKVEVQSFLTAAQQACPHCGSRVIGGHEPDAPRSAAETDPAVPEGPPRKRIAKEWEQRGMLVGGIVGAFAILGVGALGGPVGKLVVGGFGGALAGVLLGALSGVVRGLRWGLRSGDHSWVSFWVMLEAVGGMVFGVLIGTQIQRITLLMVILGALGGAVVGVICGTLVGGVLGLRAEAQSADSLEPEMAGDTVR